eukprot:SAG11_NODE_5778_length_1465_cov_7.985359_1_plen_26_part_10
MIWGGGLGLAFEAIPKSPPGPSDVCY